MDFMEMYQQMTWVAKAVAFILLIMSMWSLGVGIERFFTYQQARTQSKLYAPQVAKHLKEGRLKDAIALSSSKNYRYSHLAKVVLAGLPRIVHHRLGMNIERRFVFQLADPHEYVGVGASKVLGGQLTVPRRAVEAPAKRIVQCGR